MVGECRCWWEESSPFRGGDEAWLVSFARVAELCFGEHGRNGREGETYDESKLGFEKGEVERLLVAGRTAGELGPVSPVDVDY
jgi:hypothetical protein